MNYPDFLDIQLETFNSFFQIGTTIEERKNEGLYTTFSELFPITDARNNFVLEFIDYTIDPPRYSIEECIQRGLTYKVPLKVKLKLYCTDPDHEDFETIVQEVYFGNIPYMTQKGTFVVNGAEKVVVSQLHRSPGLFFGHSFHSNGTKLYSARVIPFKGSWIEFNTDINDVMYAYIDRKKKVPVTTLLRAIGFESDREILQIFDLADELKVTKSGLKRVIGRKLASRVLKSWVEDFVDEDTGELVSIERNEVIIERETEIEKKHIDEIVDSGSAVILLHKEDTSGDHAIIHNTLQKDPTNSLKEAVVYIYRQLRSAEPPDEATARGVIDKLFFSDQRYSLGPVGRHRINRRLKLDIPEDKYVLTNDDIISIIQNLIKLSNSKVDVDDIDHLSNRRVRTVGDQLSNQFYIGLNRMSRTIRDRMNVRDNEVFTPTDLINAKTLSSVINSFFGTSQLSQFMDQTNPLAEVTHKRRVSALGPGGLTRERAGFEVRDVHYTHYGRLCPIETPEGPNIGLISSLCVFAKVNDLGFIETPYRKVKEGKVDLNESPIYLSAEEEENKIIAQANAPINDKGEFENNTVKTRLGHDYPVTEPKNVSLMDIAPNQIASIAASLIPFLEHDDANRALMGSNMMRQAVPLLRTDSPIVGTGLEPHVAKDSRALINAEGNGKVIYVDASKITIKYNKTEQEKLISFDVVEKTYLLTKFLKTNQNTCINIKPIVKIGDKVTKGQVLCEGYATENGELALGRNLKVAFMPWKGYNFEDAIVLSERVAREDLFTSLHIEEHNVAVRETKRGSEELTSDIPNVSEEATKDLDEFGMIRVGAHVKAGNILMGKITPKGESDPTPEEKLLRAIFGEKAGDVKDASLKAKPSHAGVVIGKTLFSKTIKDRRMKAQDKEDLEVIDKEFEIESHKLKKVLVDKIYQIIGGKSSQGIKNVLGEEVIVKSVKFTQKVLMQVDFLSINPKKWTTNKDHNQIVIRILQNYIKKYNEIFGEYRRERFAITVGDELPKGVLQLASVYIAKKRKVKVGDKLAGRHGNKGIVARIVRDEDMPFLEDGTPVDIVLNPLGVPSRMNLGQIYETILGWAGDELGKKYFTPVFDGATMDQINIESDAAGIPRYGKTYLYDGGTGEKFDQPATVGIIYMLKLGHLIDDKMHARSIGPYSLITQQPLGGKAQFGGQRLGEMEVWALEGYGASNILQEMMTLKSDDVIGRAKAYESIVKGKALPKAGIPESFNVLLHELRGLGLKVSFE
ncbi:MAG: DNA-directed RNA polymerase subunit beta [Flavobacteriales bacterium]|jgi:DNA-directed RNA polymerase subunit beta|nr:DNA-directed RNA polymerase subunit beta [Flavobacteriales bacterium]